MPDDEKFLAIHPQGAEIGYGPDGKVFLTFDVSHPEFGLAPGLKLALVSSPDETRAMARELLRTADLAEKQLSRN